MNNKQTEILQGIEARKEEAIFHENYAKGLYNEIYALERKLIQSIFPDEGTCFVVETLNHGAPVVAYPRKTGADHAIALRQKAAYYGATISVSPTMVVLNFPNGEVLQIEVQNDEKGYDDAK